MSALLRLAATSMAAASAKRRVARAMRRAGFMVVAACVTIVALGFLTSALWMWLAAELTPIMASLLVGAGLIVTALIVYVAGNIMTRPEARRASQIDTAAAARLQTAVAGNAPLITNLAVIAGIGYVLGRVMSRK